MPGSSAPLRDGRPRAGSTGRAAKIAASPEPGGGGARDQPTAEPRWLPGLGRVVPPIAALAIAWYGIARPSFWRDEAYTIEAASRSPAQILALLKHSDAVHGAYYMCMHVVIAIFGRSETAVRMPSAVATAFTAAALAALATRLARLCGHEWPHASGLAAGVLYAVSPSVTRYAQEARSYAAVAGLAVIATYALVRALEHGQRRWWAAYAVAIALTGLFNMFALLIVAAHAVTLTVATRRRGDDGAAGTPTRATEGDDARGSPAIPGRPPGGSGAPEPAARHVFPAPGSAWSWAAAVTGAVVVLVPVAFGAYLQRRQTQWLIRPGLKDVVNAARFFAGSRALLVLVGALVLLAVFAVFAGRSGAGRHPLTATVVGLPWLVVPVTILLVVSQVHPVYDSRYVMFSLPAVALLAAEGLRRLAGLAARLVSPSATGALAWLPSLAVVGLICLVALTPQENLRHAWSRPDYLRKVSWIISVNARPGDAVLYVTDHSRIVSQGYPAPFRKLRDIALAQTPLASATLNGIEVSQAVLRSRMALVRRVWVISDSGRALPKKLGPLDSEKLALVGTMRRIGKWHTRDDLLFLYVRA